MSTDTKLFLTRDEAAAACSVSMDHIKKAIANGHLRAKRSGRDADGNGVGKYLISADALREWFEGLPDA